MSDEKKIRELFEVTYPQNVKNRDINAYRRMYTEDALWSPPKTEVECQGPDAIAEAFAKQIADVDIDPVFTADEICVLGHIAYVWGTSKATVTHHADHSVNHVNFRALWIVRRENNAWLIARQLWNTKP